MSDLNDKQEKFCNEYIKDLNLTQAYLRAYPDSKPETAAAAASRLLTNVKVQERIKALLKARASRMKITQDMVVQRLANIAFGDLGMICTWDDKGLVLKDAKELTTEERAIISEIDVKPVSDGDGGLLGYSRKVKMKDSIKALELLSKHLGMLDGSGAEKNNKDHAESRLRGAVGRVNARLRARRDRAK